ncbi:MAG: FAD-dependent oxidoreductase [Acidimicrobiaceae bacterium]|nr:FAD-dependent oxidoreductase [Acidimicrobiaceae bacterium]
MPDAVVVGAGPNGLVAANLLADAGWEVVLLEAQPEPGGAVSSAGYLGEGYVADVCSAFYPLAAASPVIEGLALEDFGLTWRRAPAVLAHPRRDAPAAMLWEDLERTADRLEADARSDGAAWRGLTERFDLVAESLLAGLFTPFPPVRAGAGLLRRLGASGALRLARLAVLPVRRLVEEEFSGEAAALLLAGSALHADLAPESAGSAFFGWLLTMLGQRHGFPVPEGGAQALTSALVQRFQARGGVLHCSSEVSTIEVRAGRAVGVVTDSGERYGATRAVLADVAVTRLYGGLVGWEHLPASLPSDLSRFEWDASTFKVDWALEGGVPWEDATVGEAGTVHLAESVDELSQHYAELSQGRVPARPFVLFGQANKADPSRSPAGSEVAWAYTHVPRDVRGDAGGEGLSGRWSAEESEAFVARIEGQVERYAPGFSSRVRARVVHDPGAIEAHDANLDRGSINGGTSALHQQLVFRPVPGLGRPETPIERLYLASASAHPGGGVHGACGSNAARVALANDRAGRRLVGAPVIRAVLRSLEGLPPGFRRPA